MQTGAFKLQKAPLKYLIRDQLFD